MKPTAGKPDGEVTVFTHAQLDDLIRHGVLRLQKEKAMERRERRKMELMEGAERRAVAAEKRANLALFVAIAAAILTGLKLILPGK